MTNRRVDLEIDPRPIESHEAATWLTGLGEGRRLRSWMPDTYRRYARVLHPAYAWVTEVEREGQASVPVSWSTVSEWSRQPLQRTSRVSDIAKRADGSLWFEREGGGTMPLEGELDKACLQRLVSLLVEHTATPESIWLLAWSGESMAAVSSTGYSTKRQPHRGVPLPIDRRLLVSLHEEGRRYVLVRGSLAAVPERTAPMAKAIPLPPAFWWPEDRAWCVSTDIDASSTYVGGPAGLIEKLVEDAILEAIPAELDDPYDGAA